MFEFKGKRIGNDEWVEGSGIWRNDTIPEKPVVIITCWTMENGVNTSYEYQIDPATLCVSWGLLDKNGKKVWTGDRVKLHIISDHFGTVEFDKIGAVFIVRLDRGGWMYVTKGLEIIGNVWD